LIRYYPNISPLAKGSFWKTKKYMQLKAEVG